MRVALVSAEYPPTPGGVGDYTRQLGLALGQAGLAARVWTIRAGRLLSLDPREQAPPADYGAADWGWGCWAALARAAAAERPDLLHVQYQTGAYAMRPAINLLPAWWRARRGPPLLVTAHDLLMPYLLPKAAPLRRWVTRRLLDDAAAAVVTNAADARALAGVAGPPGGLPRFVGRIRRAPALIPIGANIAPAPPAGYARAGWRAQLGLAEGDLLVAYFGLISATKGVDLLLDALAQLPPHIRLILVGGDSPAPADQPYVARLRERLRAPAVAARVIVAGHCPEPVVSAHLLAADMAALPFSDGASFRRGSLLAALAHALPTVTTLGEAAEGDAGAPALRDGVSALLVPPGDQAALAAALAQLGGHPDLRAALAAGAATLAERFAWPAIAAQHLQLYQRALAQA